MMRNKPDFSQQGLALPITLIMMVCITLVAISFVALYSKRLGLNTAYVHRYDAQYVAESGLNKYLWVLNNDYNVDQFVYQNGTYTYAGYNQEGDGYYNIECTNPPAGTPSNLNLNVTGWLASDPTNQFSFTATVQARSFTQYLYFTQQETEDDGKTVVYWRPGDVLHGKLFTDDIIHTQDDTSVNPHTTPVFCDTVSCWDGGSSNFASDVDADIAESGTSSLMQSEFQQGAPPSYLPQQATKKLSLPSYNSTDNLEQVAKSQNLYFSGRTCINLDGSEIEVANNGNTSTHYLPENAVIYVDGTDAGPINESNYDPAEKFSLGDGNVFVSGTLSGQLTIYAANNIYLTGKDPTGSPPQTGDDLSKLVTYTNTQFKEDDQTAADAYGINNTNGTDMLGLIAKNYVMVLRYGWPTDTGNGFENIDTDYSPQSDTEIDAAIMAENYSFLYECNWPPYQSSTYSSSSPYYPAPGHPSPYPALNVIGAIIQCYRGSVAGDYTNINGEAEMGCGYTKNYWYDSRMANETPPYFLFPGNSGWGILNWTMLPPANMTFTPVQGITVHAPYTTPPDNFTVPQGLGLQLTADVTPVNAPQTVTWFFSDADGNSATDPTYDETTGSTLDPYTGLLIIGTKAMGTLYVTGKSSIYPTLNTVAINSPS